MKIKDTIISLPFAIPFVILFVFSDIFGYLYPVLIIFFSCFFIFFIFVILNTKNIAYENVDKKKKKTGNLIGILLIIYLTSAIGYGIYTANQNMTLKEQEIKQMSLSGIANYLIKNKHKGRINLIMQIDRISYQNNTLEYYCYTTDGLLEKTTFFIEDVSEYKKRIQKKLINDNCTKTPLSIFLHKNGVVHYLYHRKTKSGKEFLFDINITKKMCDK